jgi:hypothetical protein
MPSLLTRSTPLENTAFNLFEVEPTGFNFSGTSGFNQDVINRSFSETVNGLAVLHHSKEKSPNSETVPSVIATKILARLKQTLMDALPHKNFELLEKSLRVDELIITLNSVPSFTIENFVKNETTSVTGDIESVTDYIISTLSEQKILESQNQIIAKRSVSTR